MESEKDDMLSLHNDNIVHRASTTAIHTDSCSNITIYLLKKICLIFPSTFSDEIAVTLLSLQELGQLRNMLRQESGPLVLTGERGSGKSALVEVCWVEFALSLESIRRHSQSFLVLFLSFLLSSAFTKGYGRGWG